MCCESIDVFDLTVDHFLENFGPIVLPCSDHKSDILMFIISEYIIMRMRQYTHMTIINQIKKKGNKKKDFKTCEYLKILHLLLRGMSRK